MTPYVETAAKAVAERAVRGIADEAQRARTLDSLMYSTSPRFMEDVYKETDRVLSPLRAKADPTPGGDLPEPKQGEAHRTGGIEGGGAGKVTETDKDKDEMEKAGTLVGDIQAIQRATGFF